MKYSLWLECNIAFFISQPQIPPEVDSALLQQVLSLPPEKLNLLPPEQREEVIKLQQRFRQIQPS